MKIYQQYTRSTNYVAFIDGLRSLAVTAVLGYHFFPEYVPHGYLGVDIFFVISGYVITYLFYQKKKVKNYTLKTFYSERTRRLLPALLLVITFGSILGYIIIHNESPALNDSLLTALFSIFGAANYYLLFDSLSYYSQNSSINIFLHTWSLGVEWQFYLLFPTILLWLNQKHISKIWLLVIFFALSSLSFLSYLHNYSKAADIAFYSFHTRAWQILSGVTIFYLSTLGIRKIKIVAEILASSALICLIILSILPFGRHWLFNVLSMFGTAAVLLTTTSGSYTDRILSLSGLRYIGKLSYSIYLWHWPLLVLSLWIFADGTIKILLILSTFIISMISYHLIEEPIRRQHFLSSIRHYTLKSVVGIMIILFIPISILLITNYFPKDSHKPKLQTHNERVILENLNADQEIIQSQLLADMFKKCNLTPHQANSNISPPIINNDWLEKCLRSSERKIVLVGDSFASNISKPLYQVASEFGYQFRIIFGYSCPYPFDKRNILSSHPRKCYADSSLVRKQIVTNLSKGDILVVRLFFQKNQYLRKMNPKAYNEAIKLLDGDVRERGATLVIVDTNPYYAINPVCAQLRSNNFNSYAVYRCSVMHLNSSAANSFTLNFLPSLEQQKIEQDLNYILVDVTGVLCDRSLGTCYFDSPSNVYQSDSTHLNSRFISLQISPKLREAISLIYKDNM